MSGGQILRSQIANAIRTGGTEPIVCSVNDRVQNQRMRKLTTDRRDGRDPDDSSSDEDEVPEIPRNKASQTEQPKDKKGNTALKDVGKFVLKTAVISGVVIGGTTVGLPLLGFGALGPTAGSIAALYQSYVGAVAAGSVFATLQSVGMVGLSAAAQTGIVAGSAAASGAHTVFSKRKEKKNSQ